MKVSGFTFIRNAVQYDYPIVEAIQSILPLCDEVVVAVGNCTDGTEELIQSIGSGKIKIIHTVWDEGLRDGGRVLAIETDKAFRAIAQDADWAFYIQGDEVLPEQYIEVVREGLTRYRNDRNVDGLLFNYVHFYGSYDYVGESSRWYRREIRIVRNDKSIFSFRDAQGFRKNPNGKLRVKLIPASIYHYGWVRNPVAMQGKQKSFNKYWHDDQWMEKNISKASEFDYSEIDALVKFMGKHPDVMLPRIKSMNWKFDHNLSKNKFSWKDKFKRVIEKFTGWRPGEYKNYKII
jgi:hypothetical protein